MNETTILLLDADGDSEALVSEAATLTGRDVLVAKTSRAAFRILGEQMQRLEIVVVDVDPGAHGLALLEAISSCADRPPIVVITALEETYMEPIARKHGAAACLGKPITVRRLTATLKNSSTRSLTSGGWEIFGPVHGWQRNRYQNPPERDRRKTESNRLGAQSLSSVHSEAEKMRGKTPIQEKRKKSLAQNIRPVHIEVSEPVTLHRRSPFEFSCGINFERALRVEESLDERERRG